MFLILLHSYPHVTMSEAKGLGDSSPSTQNDMGIITQFHKHIKCHPSI